MCGFVAVIGQRIERSTLEKGLLAIKHRGPDEHAIWQNETKDVSLGHARLSIIDLAGGTQPLSNEDESLVTVVNGEFYDYQGIRQTLIEDGYRFKTRSDSEIILGLYERYGTACLKYLRGEFAFVLWDKKNHLVFAARDYFGIKPLFYTVIDGALFFASEAKAFKGLGLSLSFDQESFVQTIGFFALPDSSLFKKVYQIPPAHFLIKSQFAQKPYLKPYWDFNYPKVNDKAPVMSEEEAILGFREQLINAIQLRLKADVPVACYLSGGLDSCSILGIAQHLSKKPIDAFTLTFEHEDYDEATVAREMAQLVNARFHPISIKQDDIAHGMEDAVWHAERFMINGHGVAKYLLSEAVHQKGIKVVLTGEGSDEIFGGYAHFRQDMILANEQLSVLQKESLMADLKKANKVSSALVYANELNAADTQLAGLLGFVPAWIRGYSAFKPLLLEVLTGEMREKYATRNGAFLAFSLLDIAGQVEGRDLLSRSLYLWSRTVLPYYLLTVLGDRMEMAHSIEGRVPFLDHHLVDYVVRMPSSVKIKDMKEKYALREAAKPFISKTVYERQKHPFLAPPAFLSAKVNAMTELINDTLRGRHMARVAFLDQKKIINIVDRYESFSLDQKAQYDILLMALTSAALLMKRLSE